MELASSLRNTLADSPTPIPMLLPSHYFPVTSNNVDLSLPVFCTLGKWNCVSCTLFFFANLVYKIHLFLHIILV